VKTAISIPDPLFAAAERFARRRGMSRSELYQQAVESYLRERQDEGVTAALNAVHGADQRKAGVDPMLQRMQIASIAADDWP
jgi:metal-responsive CopG/Arc/MetJ family transcriptional regulator